MFAEFRFAARTLARWRGGFAVAVATVAIGIGTTTSLYSVVRILLAEFPGVPQIERVGRVYAASRALGVERAPVALTEFDRTLSRTAAFSAAAAYAPVDATLGHGDSARPVNAAMVSPGFFNVLGVAPAQGRALSAADVALSTPVIVISHSLWLREFRSGEPGARLAIDGIERTVIGVMPPEFSYPFVGVSADVWIPLGPASAETPAIATVFARLANGMTWAQAGSELDALARDTSPWTWQAIPLAADARSRAIGAYASMLGPAVLVLLITCVNVACLLLARGLERDREIAVRRALGAGRSRIATMLLGESLMLAGIGGALGASLAMVILRAVAASLSTAQPALAAQIQGGAGLVPVAMAVAAVACALFGLLPAARLSGRDFVASLNGRSTVIRTRAGDYSARDVVVFAEVASAVGLMVWAAMLFTLFAQLRAVHFSFPADQIVAMRVPAKDAGDVALRVEAISGVSAVAVSSGMLGGGDRIRVTTPEGRSAVMARVPIGPGFLETLKVPILRGRALTTSDMNGATGALVLSQTAAATLAPNGDALGMRLQASAPGPRELVVVGICSDAVDHGALSRTGLIPAEVYEPFDARAVETVVLARLTGEPHALLSAIAAAAQSRPNTRPARAVVLSDEFAASRRRDSLPVVVDVLGVLAVVSLLLAASGVFGVISQSVTQRRREFGIRLAIGAEPRRVLGMVLAREGKLIAAAIVVGLAFALGFTRALFEELTTLNAARPGVAVASALASVFIVALACALATWRILKLQPAAILRRP